MALTGHGIEHIAFGNLLVSPRIFCSVRDLHWASPAISLRYQVGEDGIITFEGAVEEHPLQVSGSIELVRSELAIGFTLRVLKDVEVCRAGPCVLHQIPPGRRVISTDLPGEAGSFTIDSEIAAAPPASGFSRLCYYDGGAEVTIRLEGERFELEDQRNWSDDSLKSYCPPLGYGTIRLQRGTSLTFAVRLSVRPAPTPLPVEATRSLLAQPLPPKRCNQGFVPEIGLTHPGGALNTEQIDRLSLLRPGIIHLLVELDQADWLDRLALDLELARQLGAGAVLTVDCPEQRHGQLSRLCEQAAGRVDTAFLFDAGSPLTSDRLAAEGRKRFDGSGVRVGAGTRGHFASLNQAGRVPEEAQLVAVSLAAAAHDDDRRALTTGLGSIPTIISQARRIAGGRELYLGPTGFAATFDSWSIAGHQRALRESWDSGHRRQQSVFAAAWLVAEVACIVPCGVGRACLAGTVGGRAVLASSGAGRAVFPAFRALELLSGIGFEPLSALPPGGRIAGISFGDWAVVALMADVAPTLAELAAGEEVIAPAAQAVLSAEGDQILPSPGVVLLDRGRCVSLFEREA